MNRFALLLLILIGCKPAEEIRSYAVPKEILPKETLPEVAAETPSQPASQPAGEPTDRMLGAMLPAESQAWFFKLAGPKAAVDAVAEQVTKFYAAVKLDGGEPSWELPEGWKQAAASGMRFATLQVPSEGKELELSVIGLPRVGDWSKQALDNANRWRGQMKLPPVDQDAATKIDGATPDAMLVDLNGWFEAGSMTPPMMQGARTPVAPPSIGPPVAQNPVAQPQAAAEEFSSTPPEGWREGQAGMMRKATFLVGDAEAAVTMFGAVEMMVDPLANLNRWRDEVGLPAAQAGELNGLKTEISVDNSPAQRFEIVGDELATLAVMTRRGEQMWFFKLKGPKGTVAAHTKAFDEWIASVKFSSGAAAE